MRFRVEWWIGCTVAGFAFGCLQLKTGPSDDSDGGADAADGPSEGGNGERAGDGDEDPESTCPGVGCAQCEEPGADPLLCRGNCNDKGCGTCLALQCDTATEFCCAWGESSKSHCQALGTACEN